MLWNIKMCHFSAFKYLDLDGSLEICLHKVCRSCNKISSASCFGHTTDICKTEHTASHTAGVHASGWSSLKFWQFVFLKCCRNIGPLEWRMSEKRSQTAFPLFHGGKPLLACDETETWHIWDVDMKGGRSGCTSSHNTTHNMPIQCSWGPFAAEKTSFVGISMSVSPNKKQPMRYILYSGYKNIHILQIVFKPRYCPQGDS